MTVVSSPVRHCSIGHRSIGTQAFAVSASAMGRPGHRAERSRNKKTPDRGYQVRGWRGLASIPPALVRAGLERLQTWFIHRYATRTSHRWTGIGRGGGSPGGACPPPGAHATARSHVGFAYCAGRRPDRGSERRRLKLSCVAGAGYGGDRLEARVRGSHCCRAWDGSVRLGGRGFRRLGIQRPGPSGRQVRAQRISSPFGFPS